MREPSTDPDELSPSHVQLWVDCPRKEAFQYRQGLKTPSAKSAEAGNAVHEFIEAGRTDWEYEWEGYPVGKMAKNLLAKTPSTVNKREEHFHSVIDGIKYHGYVDFQDPFLIGDYKTTSKKKYIKTVDELHDNVQRLIYTESFPLVTQNLWLYGVWDAKQSVHPVTFPVDRKADRERFKLRVLKPSEEILATPKDVDPLSLPLPKDPDTCKLYPPHGCPFKLKCFPIKSVFVQSTEGFPKMSSLLEKLSATIAEEPRTVREPEAPASTHKIEWLFVDCFPVTGETPIQASKIVMEAAATVATDMQVAHPLLVDFGKGGPMLMAQTADFIAKGPNLKYVYLETKSAESRGAMNAFIQHARHVVKSMF